MPTVMLSQTRGIMDRYGKDLISGEISEDNLGALKEGVFGCSTNHPDLNRPVTDENFNQLAGMQNFVEHIGPLIPKNILHALVDRMISRLTTASDEGEGFMRTKNSLAKVMLTYELSQYPEEGKRHLDENVRLTRVFREGVKKENFISVLLKPGIDFFKLAELKKYYKYAPAMGETGRQHSFAVSGTDELRAELKTLRGDALKAQILSDFKRQLEGCTNKGSFNEKAKELKQSPEYKILATGQDRMTRLFGLKTSSVKAFERMVNELSKDLPEEPTASPS